MVCTARSSAEPKDTMTNTPLVLFVCVHNAGRSRMAEAFFTHLAGERYRGASAGTQPAAAPHPEVVESMQARGIPVLEGPGRLLTTESARQATKIIGMGCAVEEACPALRVPLEDWKLEDPKNKSRAEIDAIRDEIEARVRALVAELDANRA